MIRLIASSIVALALAGCGYGGSILAPLGFAASESSGAERLPGRVYLFRGLIGDIFSLGMDELAAKIEKRGIKASVHGISAALMLADRIIADYRADKRTAPIVLIGHSSGGDAMLSVAHRLKAANVPVALAFGFDPTPIAARVPSNVEVFINLYQGTNIIGGGSAKPDSDFRGRIINVDLRERREILHITLDKSDVIHDLVLRKIVSASEQVAAAVRTELADRQSSSRSRDVRARGNMSVESAPEPSLGPLTLRYVVPQDQTIELWDSAAPVVAQVGDSVESIAQRTGAPAWAIAQVNGLERSAAITQGQKVLVPRHAMLSPGRVAGSGSPAGAH